jgi:LCP family protein required for cell wall assembly
MAHSSGPVSPYDPLPPHLDPRGKHRNARSHAPRSGRKGITRAVLGVVTLLSIATLIVSGYVWYTYRDINKNVTRLKVAVGAPPSGKTDIDGKDQNILLVGNDDRQNMTAADVKKLKVGRGSGSDATDTMMIMHIPADGKKATLISLPRDSYVSIPGHGKAKLNAAYVDGLASSSGTADDKRAAGADLLISTVEQLTGLTINHYVQVSLMGFYDISNAVGGVTVNLCNAVDDTKQANGGDGGSGLVLSKGKHVISGVQALEFVRQRHGLKNGDLDRVRRQQYFLAAAFRKVASVGILFKLKSLGDAIQRNVYLDPSLDLIGLAKQMENLSANNIVGKTIPFQRYEDVEIGGVSQSVEIVSPAKVQAFVAKLIAPPAPAPPTTPATGTTTTPPAGSGSTTSTTSTAPAPIDSKCIN